MFDAKEFCTGCGLCVSQLGIDFVKGEDGFYTPDAQTEEFEHFCSQVCPASGVQCNKYERGEIWGRYAEVYYAYASDDDIRYTASSGGVLTAFCIFLLEKGYVDGIIQVMEDEKKPIGTRVVCSTSREQIIKACGSRYSSSAPLSQVHEYLNRKGKRYAFVGKPCDVVALRNYGEINSDVTERFPYMLSFFCAGAPSEKANLRLLEKMGITLKECKSLKYRGDGWPGYATAVDYNNDKHKIFYREAWRDTLGRDVRRICRFCLDGIGELADISCGDAWYLSEKGEPVFEEGEGRNIVFIRNEKIKKLFLEAVESGYVTKEICSSWKKDIQKYQKYQYNRRANMLTMLLALKIKKRNRPLYNIRLLMSYLNKDIRWQFKFLIGTLVRIKEGKI